MHSMGWAQLAHYAQVRAFAEGQAEIDPWHWETNDKAWIEGHFYSVKSPGTAALTTPLYMAIEGVGGLDTARDAALNARDTEWPRWSPEESPAIENYGYDPQRGRVMEERLEAGTPVAWVLTLLAAVIPAVLLLFGVRWVGDRVEPGYGTAAAITLGIASMLMVFAAEYFSHVAAAALGFAAFLVLMRERDGEPSWRAVGIAGALAGLAISFEYQVGLVGVVLFFYALARSAPRLPRAAVYAAGGLVGVIPALAFNVWALGSPFEFAYGAAVDTPGFSGHDTLGLNSDGFFGITAPRLDAVVDLLVANRGLLVLTPVIVAALAGVVLLRRGRHRTEANVIIAVAAVYFVYNAGYWLTFGGGTPGPRFLIPALPFVAVGLAPAYRRFPARHARARDPLGGVHGRRGPHLPAAGRERPRHLARVPLGRALRAHGADCGRRLQRLARPAPRRCGADRRDRARGQGDPGDPRRRPPPRGGGRAGLDPDRRPRSRHRRRQGHPARRRPEPDLPGGRRGGRLAAGAGWC